MKLGQPNVNGQTLGTMLVPLPSLAEQHRIVAKVDESMVLYDRLEASLTAGEETRGRLRETVRPTRNKRGWKVAKFVLSEAAFLQVLYVPRAES